jgi:hypothetical protein
VTVDSMLHVDAGNGQCLLLHAIRPHLSASSQRSPISPQPPPHPSTPHPPPPARPSPTPQGKPKVEGSKDDIFGQSTGKSRKKTEEGFNVYTEDELGMGRRGGGDTDACPFDCDCCY